MTTKTLLSGIACVAACLGAPACGTDPPPSLAEVADAVSETASTASLPAYRAEPSRADSSDGKLSLSVELKGDHGQDAVFGIDSVSLPPGEVRLQVGTAEAYGVVHGLPCGTNSCCTVTDHLDAYPFSTFPKNYYLRMVPADGSAPRKLGTVTISIESGVIVVGGAVRE